MNEVSLTPCRTPVKAGLVQMRKLLDTHTEQLHPIQPPSVTSRCQRVPEVQQLKGQLQLSGS